MELINDYPMVISLDPDDNVGVATRNIAEGLSLSQALGAARENIMAGHKVALVDIEANTPVVKYGQTIGLASQPIRAGDHVHTHNLAMLERDTSLENFTPAVPTPVMESDLTFNGFHRRDGRVGTRNYIGIVATVNCSATVVKATADQLNASAGLEKLGFDGVVPVTHGSGCAMNTESEGFAFLERVVTGYAVNPNFAFVIVIGLGCESNQVKALVDKYGMTDSQRIDYFNIQGAGGTRASIKLASDKVLAMANTHAHTPRQPAPLKHLTVALQCGGSDGYSGITANPALGYAADLIVQHGGSVILAETPEIYGAEHLLLNRAVDVNVARKLLEHIAWWKHYTWINGAELNNNPSPGNKAGGLSTILEKSLGAISKSGSSSLSDVLEYAEPIKKPGFNFMDSPGYDPVSVTGQIASGSTIVCFTTGRGSVSGFKPAPCIKLATNTAMFDAMSEDMDINCGGIIDGDDTVKSCGEAIFQKIIAIASGEETASETLGYGSNEFVPWMVGAVT
ncbi:altronate hydrolase [Vreelandella subterranea]|uniref:Altronate hydrolase n=1 Tax=Vreelandella subterranea TaxID=416874 RepID=A0A1H9R7R6_9GAMM|nr:altronate dehydratase family protein [Halomonas subterranea]SER68099.1 altronate hydrolase [Halomonas subterranea]